MTIDLLVKATAFVWHEADMLDHREYDAWLALWSPGGHYVVPIDPDATTFTDSLNFAYDNHEMRKKRVHRLRSGKSISTVPSPRTVHQVSRVRVLSSSPDIVVLRTAQEISEFRKQTARRHVADVTYELVPAGESFLIRDKVVRLINSTDALSTVGFIF